MSSQSSPDTTNHLSEAASSTHQPTLSASSTSSSDSVPASSEPSATVGETVTESAPTKESCPGNVCPSIANCDNQLVDGILEDKKTDKDVALPVTESLSSSCLAGEDAEKQGAPITL